ncbi:aspartate aminotransferase family protein [uncultured Pseudoteredinibacter sp.]|uniref:aspartate aminotransferase family protein n=1 Tax=uncultured Pseudoteredinibacter sp. TaxID=1641701 RepID=UPI002637A626|nr:aspartate aminotransferase family protein [uncultured Pseudoteredinibacter sp.]
MSEVRSTAQWQELDAKHHLHPFTDFKELAEKGSRIIVKAEGVYIYDSEGNQVLDGMAGLWCCNLGYGRKEIVEAVNQQLTELPFYNNFFQCSHPPSIELSRLLTEIAPEHMNNVFYTNSGSEANDTVIRMIHRFWDLQEQPERKTIIARKNGYHGSTIAAGSLGGMNGMHKQYATLPGIVHIDQPYWFGEGGDTDPAEFGVQVARQLEAKIDELGADKVAAFIAEPIQGAGGVIVPPESYWPEISRICEEKGILLVCDEVICGFGRTGEWFGSTYYGAKPDLMPFAKGVTNGYQPLGGVMVSDRVADVLKSKGGEFTHGFTYSGHPAACAAAIATIKSLQEGKYIERVREETGPYLQKRWAELAEHPLVGETRGVGFLAALELVKDKASRERFDDDCTAGAICRDACTESGLVMRAVGDMMVVAPPLTLTKEQIDELVEKAKKALDITLSKLT